MEGLIHYKEFVKIIEKLGRRHSVERVFSDFLILATCAYHPQTIATRGQRPDADNEAEYMQVAKAYTRDELNDIAKLMSLVMLQAAERPYSDLLGEFFTEHVTRGRNGQFFTPDSICVMMAKMQIGDEPPVNKTVADPACGSGRMLLAFAEEAPGNTFYASDVDAQCARMTVLNFFANGMTGEVAWMNALSMECWRGWHVHAGFFGVLPVPVEQCALASRPLKQEATPAAPMVLPPLPSEIRGKQVVPVTSAQQLTLF